MAKTIDQYTPEEAIQLFNETVETIIRHAARLKVLQDQVDLLLIPPGRKRLGNKDRELYNRCNEEAWEISQEIEQEGYWIAKIILFHPGLYNIDTTTLIKPRHLYFLWTKQDDEKIHS